MTSTGTADFPSFTNNNAFFVPNRQDTLAKLLATENITIIYDYDLSTAKFDPKNRQLFLPCFCIDNQNLHDWFIAHECAHALYTDPNFTESLKLIDSNLPNILIAIYQIVEDVRIEKLIRQQYPGTKSDHFQGYKYALTLKYFPCSTIDEINALCFADRINLHYKVGIHFLDPVEFLPGLEQDLKLEFENNLVTHDDTLALVKKIYERREELKLPELQSESQPGPSVSKVKWNFTGNKDESPINEFGNPSNAFPSQQKLNDLNLPDKALKKQHAKFAAAFPNILNWKDFVLPYKDILLKSQPPKYQHYADYYQKNKKTIAYMMSEFNRRKAAITHERIKTYRTGSIDPLKLYSYKFDDKIFKTYQQVPKGKKHGVVLLLDFSSSMAKIIAGIIEQTLNLVHLCKRLNIPCEVYGYTFNSRNGKSLQYDTSIPIYLKPSEYTCVYQLFSTSKMSKLEIEKMSNLLLDNFPLNATSNKMFAMNNTPAMQAVILCKFILEEFRRANKIDILNFVHMTDGSPNDSVTINKNRLEKIQSYDKIDVYNPKNGKIYKSRSKVSYDLFKIFNDFYRDILDINIIGFYLADNSTYGIFGKTINANKFKSDGYIDLCGNDGKEESKFLGFDRFYVVDSKKISMQPSDSTDFKSIKQYQFFLNEFVESLAKRMF